MAGKEIVRIASVSDVVKAAFNNLTFPPREMLTSIGVAVTNFNEGGRLAVEPIEIQEEMERSFLDYAMTVITARALPDVRDGLKPVQRRILWGMHDIGARPDRSLSSCSGANSEA